jgi:hypothetical protein
MLYKGDWSNILIPTSSSMVGSLPADNDHRAQHNPFPDGLPTINGFERSITLLNSKQRPRKIVILGSDGYPYTFLCKPDDDLRKDNRIMDFCSIVNKLLKADAETRQRQLHVRTYAVVPLNETCGIIEWVRFLPISWLLFGRPVSLAHNTHMPAVAPLRCTTWIPCAASSRASTKLGAARCAGAS